MASPQNSSKDADWYACPFCGTEVRVGSKGCPGCTPGQGKSWQQDSYLDGVDVPDDPEEFDYKDFVKREFGTTARVVKPGGLKWIWWITGVLLLAAMIAGVIIQLLRQ